MISRINPSSIINAVLDLQKGEMIESRHLIKRKDYKSVFSREPQKLMKWDGFFKALVKEIKTAKEEKELIILSSSSTIMFLRNK